MRPNSLQTTDHVFIRRDLAKPAPSPPYRGSTRILERSDTAYMLDKHSKQECVSLYRLKSAYCETVDYATHTSIY